MLDGYYNSGNSHIWNYGNLQTIAVLNQQQRFPSTLKLNVGIHLLRPVILTSKLTLKSSTVPAKNCRPTACNVPQFPI